MTDDEWVYFEPFLTVAVRRTTIAVCSMGFLVDANRRAVARSAGGVRQLEFDLSAIPPLG
jgi:hypothetical protein